MVLMLGGGRVASPHPGVVVLNGMLCLPNLPAGNGDLAGRQDPVLRLT